MSKTPLVVKTIKLFINGEFPRTESGRSFPVFYNGSEKLYAHLCRSSRKDLRNAVQMAKKAQPIWTSKTAYNRAQILYRMAEMFEVKKSHFVQLGVDILGLSQGDSEKQVDLAQETFLYYAGFADKYSQVMASVNPVSGPFHNFTTPDAVGVVGLLYDKTFALNEFVAQLCSVICSGNSVVAVFDAPGAVYISELGEVFKTSDLPAGVVNLLSGQIEELASHMGGHMELNSILVASDDQQRLYQIKELGIENMKRVVPWTFPEQSLEPIVAFTEAKTVWHPVGL